MKLMRIFSFESFPFFPHSHHNFSYQIFSSPDFIRVSQFVLCFSSSFALIWIYTLITFSLLFEITFLLYLFEWKFSNETREHNIYIERDRADILAVKQKKFARESKYTLSNSYIHLCLYSGMVTVLWHSGKIVKMIEEKTDCWNFLTGLNYVKQYEEYEKKVPIYKNLCRNYRIKEQRMRREHWNQRMYCQSFARASQKW